MYSVSEVRFLDERTVFIKKDKQIVGESNPIIGVALRDSTVIVANMRQSLNSVPIISLVKECSSEEEAVRAFYRVIGKMCKKSYESKYFDNARVCEHLHNGNPKGSNLDTERYIKIARALHEKYEGIFS